MTTSTTPIRVNDDVDAEVEILDALDEMDAPSDWDAGTITFDPYI